MKNLLIVWSDVHKTRIPIIDEQHRGIVSIINNLFYFMGEQRAAEIFVSVVVMLEQYTKLHFMAEESLLELAKYEKIDEHKALHQKLMADMSTASIKARRDNDPGEFLFFLKKWWLTHINGVDHDYAPIVREALREFGSTGEHRL